MAARIVQRDQLAFYKQETCQNARSLSKIYRMPAELAHQLFKNDALEKPTQQFFIHFSYYLVCIIDPHKASKITWPLYDSKSEKTYRNEFSSLIDHYCKMGVLSPVVSSYFVNPGCLKVIILMFQISNLAVEQALQSKASKKFKEVQEKFKSRSNELLEYVCNETRRYCSRIEKYQQMKKVAEEASEASKNKHNENKLIQDKNELQNLIDNCVKAQCLEGENKAEIEAIKNINKPVEILDHWLQNLDDEMTSMETIWDEKMSPLLETSQQCQENAEGLILRHTGESDKNTYMIEYDPKTDDMYTKDLEAQVNSQQKYILKNIINNNRLNFPNLIRGFVISKSFVLKNVEIDYDIQLFSDCLEANQHNFSEVLKAFRILMERVLDVESKLKPPPTSSLNQYHQSTLPSKDITLIPALPDFSDLKFSSMDNLIHFESFTPLNISKLHLRRKASAPTFVKPQVRSVITPFHAPRDDFLQTVILSRIKSRERPELNMSQNLSMISHGTTRGNETIASGFTQQQLQRLLSTKKTSSTKKHNSYTSRRNTKMQRGELFKESTESTGLFRSYSSPNLFDSREHRSFSRSRARQLSIMQEDACSLLEVSGIALLESNSRCETPRRIANLESSRKLVDATSLPVIMIHPSEAFNNLNYFKETEDLTRLSPHLKATSQCSSTESLAPTEKSAETPKPALPRIRKTSSIEKIINRLEKVRATTNPDVKKTRTILEEKENNLNAVNVDVLASNRILLPDLLSPSFSVVPQEEMSRSNYFEEACLEMDSMVQGTGRESLGTALGVDHTIMDQYDW